MKLKEIWRDVKEVNDERRKLGLDASRRSFYFRAYV